MKKTKSDNYKKAGVDIDAGDEVVRRIKKIVPSTFRKEVASDIGGFGALFKLDKSKYDEPLLVSSTDGVGTKLKVAFACDKHDTVGIDLVAMSVNDILVQGAEPLFFLDYFATGKLLPDVAEQIISGIAEGCRQAGCALIGGETAEMPSMYPAGEYDLAGFAVGIVDKKNLIDGKKIKDGDVILGVASTGVHSNGFSLVRRIIFEKLKLSVNDKIFDEKTVGEVLLTPTKIYVKQMLEVFKHATVKGIVHVTGGGFYENIIRILPENTYAEIKRGSFPVLPIFKFMQEKGNIPEEEMYRVFNMGIGLVVVVDKKDVLTVQKILKDFKEDVYVIGEIKTGAMRVEMK